jgi:hypothetical protein
LKKLKGSTTVKVTDIRTNHNYEDDDDDYEERGCLCWRFSSRLDEQDLIAKKLAKSGAFREMFEDRLNKDGIIAIDGKYYRKTKITDKGFNKWEQAYESTAKLIKWVSLLLSFKFYRMTYSYFMGNKKFLVIYQKKKFKKHTVMVTLISQFLVKLPILVSGIVSISSLPFGE